MSTRTHRFIVHSPRARWFYSYDSLALARAEWPDRVVHEQKKTKGGKGWVEWTTTAKHQPEGSREE